MVLRQQGAHVPLPYKVSAGYSVSGGTITVHQARDTHSGIHQSLSSVRLSGEKGFSVGTGFAQPQAASHIPGEWGSNKTEAQDLQSKEICRRRACRRVPERQRDVDRHRSSEGTGRERSEGRMPLGAAAKRQGLTGFTRKATRKGWLGAENGIRTRDLNLGKVALYQLSYFRVGTTKVVTISIIANFFSVFCQRAQSRSAKSSIQVQSMAEMPCCWSRRT